jgi:hypothetical protein
MATNAVIAHRIPGRVRLVIRERRGDVDYFADLSDRLTRFPSVQNSRVNATTGSIALEFAGSVEDILRQAEEEDLLSIIEGVTVDVPLRSMIAPINLVSGREINRMFMVGSLLVVVGLIQTLRGEWFPPAFSVFWAAAEAFRLAERPYDSVGAEVDGTPATVPS